MVTTQSRTGMATMLERRSTDRSTAAAGLLALLAGAVVLMGITTAEALYPSSYSPNRNTVSDLAAMRPENVVRQPSAFLFNGTMIVAGAMIIVAAYLLHKVYFRHTITIPVIGLGLGMVGVGIFPGTHMAFHQLFSMLAFTSGGIAAVLTASLQRGALRFIHRMLGAVALSFLIVGVLFADWGPAHRLGEGGVERWIVYPVLLWLVTFGTALIVRQAERGRVGADAGTTGVMSDHAAKLNRVAMVTPAPRSGGVSPNTSV
jgi:hypothetical membrane protein